MSLCKNCQCDFKDNRAHTEYNGLCENEELCVTCNFEIDALMPIVTDACREAFKRYCKDKGVSSSMSLNGFGQYESDTVRAIWLDYHNGWLQAKREVCKQNSVYKVFTPVFGFARETKREEIHNPLDLLEIDFIKKTAEGKNFYKFAYNENGEIFALRNEGHSWQVIGNIDFTKEEFERIGINEWGGEKYKVNVDGAEVEIDKDHIVKTNKAFMAMAREGGRPIDCKFSCGDYTLDDMQNMNTGEMTVLMDNAIKLKENYEKE